MTTQDQHGDNPVDTTELRWFAHGSVPHDVRSWFTRSGTVGTVEDRTDNYMVDPRSDIGVKQRSGTTLELKILQSVGEPLALGADLTGRTEDWRKWSPAKSPPTSGHELPWIAVRKRIVRRLFSGDGDESAFSYATRAAMAAGCDAELVNVSVGDLAAWTFAFAAFGPAHGRRDAILGCWQALTGGDPVPADLAARLAIPASYPLWLDLFAEDR